MALSDAESAVVAPMLLAPGVIACCCADWTVPAEEGAVVVGCIPFMAPPGDVVVSAMATDETKKIDAHATLGMILVMVWILGTPHMRAACRPVSRITCSGLRTN